jgi:serine/threonine-protein kinase
LVLASSERSFEECDALPRDSSASFPTPSAFGRYRVVHQVGVGVLGPVFRGYDPEQDRVVAIKAIFLDLTPEQAADVAADFDRLSSLSIPRTFIISPFAGGHEGSVAFLVQEYFVADSADVALKQYGPPPVPDALRLIGQLAGALDAAAAAGVHHGALHLRDVLVAPHELRLTGLGVVPAIERVGYRLQPRRPYAAPERMMGQPVTLASDVFSLACLSFELLTGRRPVPSGDGVTADTSEIQAADAPALSEVFARVLSARPEDRHPSALEFAAALKHALTGAPLQAGAEYEPPKPRRARARKAAVLPFDEEPQTPPAEPAPVVAAPEPTPESASERSVVVEPRPIAEPGQVAEPEPIAEPERGAEPEPVFATAPVLEPEILSEPELVADAEPEPIVATVPIEVPIAEPVSRVPIPVRIDKVELAGHEDEDEPIPEPVSDTSERQTPADRQWDGPRFSTYSDDLPAGRGAVAPRRNLGPLLGMLGVGLVVGFVIGYLAAPRGAQVPAAATAVSATAAATPVATAPSSGPAPTSPPTAQAVAPPAPAEKSPTPAKAARGTLVVGSKPAGALVFIDGHEAGRTPLTVRDVKPGSRKVRLELNGYRPWSSTVRVAAGRQRKIAASLERRPGG